MKVDWLFRERDGVTGVGGDRRENLRRMCEVGGNCLDIHWVGYGLALANCITSETKYLARSNLRKQGLTLAHSLKGCSPAWQGRHGSRQKASWPCCMCSVETATCCAQLVFSFLFKLSPEPEERPCPHEERSPPPNLF